jgi:hypothetical protein
LYTKEQASQIKQAFWKAFGQYMALHLSADGLKINWINYKTGIKHLSFKMLADQQKACIMIEMSQPDTGMQELMFEQFAALKKILNEHLLEDWNWELHTIDEYGKPVSRISKCIEQVNILNQNDWPQLITFFKPRMIALDTFWNTAQYGFEIFKN